jgi:hypothetical protein
MISYFPQMYPDELLYSACARYKKHVNLKAQKTSVEILFGNRNLTATIDLPSNIKMLLEQIPSEVIASETLIKNHTLFPFFKPFLPLERVGKVYDLMLNNPDKQNIQGTIGLMSYGISSPRKLRFCEECVKEDRYLFGELYWHRNHQLPGVFYCDKHKKILLETTINYTSRGRKHYFVTLEEVIEGKLYHNFSNTFNEKSSEFLLNVSIMACDLLKQDITPIGFDNIRKNYIDLLSKEGYITPNYNVRFRDLINRFRNYFGYELLSKLESKIQKETDTWLHKLLRKPRVTCHPIRHILLLLFLKTDIMLFEKSRSNAIHPFGKGPWLCLNRVANHYQQPTINECKITYCKISKLPIGTLKCNCGFIYSRKGPDKGEEDRFKLDRIKCFGKVWIAECQHLFRDPKLSLRAKAKIMGVDPKTILKYSSKTGTDTTNKIKYVDTSELERRKEGILLTISNHTNPNRTIIRRDNAKDYTWHYRNNREWLYSILPSKYKNHRNIQRVNWSKVDEESLKQVKSAIAKVLKYEGKPVRITKAEISRRIDNPNLIEYSLKKIPRTKEILSKYIESTEEYQIRRINWVVNNWTNDNEISIWRIKRKAGIKGGTVFINKYLEIMLS